MILGMDTLTFVHVAISLVAIVAGFVVLSGLLRSHWPAGWTAFFLATTIATSATGFLFAFDKLLPSHIIAIISLVALAVAVLAAYVFGRAGVWRAVYVVSAIFALYLNVFVLVAQAFMKVPALNALAPTQAEPPFFVAQLILLVAFVAVGTLALRRFRVAAVG